MCWCWVWGLPGWRWRAGAPRPVRAAGDSYEVDLDLLSGLPGFERLAGDDAPFVRVEGDAPLYRMK